MAVERVVVGRVKGRAWRAMRVVKSMVCGFGVGCEVVSLGLMKAVVGLVSFSLSGSVRLSKYGRAHLFVRVSCVFKCVQVGVSIAQ
jgi:hypothetical protein